jgi:hypothetical protein
MPVGASFILKQNNYRNRGDTFVPERHLVLTILDGWGYRAETTNNAIALANSPPATSCSPGIPTR